MKNFFKNLFMTDVERQAQMQAIKDAASQEATSLLLAQQEAERVATLQAAEEAAALKAQMAATIEAERIERHMASNVPWLESNIDASDDSPLIERYNWNEAFMDRLRKMGYTGKPVEMLQGYFDAKESEERKRIVEIERDARKASSEPWVEVIGENIDDDGRIELQLDWNKPFIDHLRTHGFTGKTDEQLVQLWLACLDRDMGNGDYDAG